LVNNRSVAFKGAVIAYLHIHVFTKKVLIVFDFSLDAVEKEHYRRSKPCNRNGLSDPRRFCLFVFKRK